MVFQGTSDGNQSKSKNRRFSRTNLLCRYAIWKRNGISLVYAKYNSKTNATITCKMLVKIGPVVSAENRLTNEIVLHVHVVWLILSNISGYTGPIFTIFPPYESSLCTDDGSVLFFPNLVNFRPVIAEFTLLIGIWSFS